MNISTFPCEFKIAQKSAIFGIFQELVSMWRWNLSLKKKKKKSLHEEEEEESAIDKNEQEKEGEAKL